MRSQRRVLSRTLAPLLGAIVGVVLFSGSDQPVTAHPYPPWQQLAAPPLSVRTHALGVRVGHRLLVLGGRGAGGTALRDGAAYDVRTGSWRRVRTPVYVTDRDRAAAAAGVVILRHLRTGRPASWWRYDTRHDVWSRMRLLRPSPSVPSAFGSEVYALSGRHVMVYSVQLDRWTPLPADPLRPAPRKRTVTASSAGTVVTGYVGHPSRLVSHRWDGVSWHRLGAVPPSAVQLPPTFPPGATTTGSTSVRVGGRLVVLSGGRAWIHTP
jgi:hypothetical protein